MNELASGLSRRSLLKLSSGLVVAFSLFKPAESMAQAAAGPIPGGVPPDAGRLYAWLAVHPDDTATLFTGKVDLGTGAETALAQIAAEELDFPIDRLNVVMGSTAETVNQGHSGGSRTIRYAGPQIRHAAAAGRQAFSILQQSTSKFRRTSFPSRTVSSRWAALPANRSATEGWSMASASPWRSAPAATATTWWSHRRRS